MLIMCHVPVKLYEIQIEISLNCTWPQISKACKQLIEVSDQNSFMVDLIDLNPIQAMLFLPFKGPRGVFRDLMISGTSKASQMKLCTVIVLLNTYQNTKRNFQKYDL